MKKHLILFILSLFAITANAQDGKLNQSYVPQSPFTDITAMARLSDGSLLVAGYNYNNGAIYDFIKLKPDGSLEPASVFNFTFTVPYTNNTPEITAICPLPNGKILIGGGFYQECVMQLNSNGSVDTSFDSEIPVGPHVTDILIQPVTNMILVSTAGPSVNNGLYRLDSSGNLDTTFIEGYSTGGSNSPSVYDIETYSDGSILVIGKFALWAGTPRSGIVKLNPDSSINPVTFPAFENNYANDATIQPDGKIVVVGGDNTATTAPQIVRFNANGTVDTSFYPPTPGPGVTNHSVVVVERQSDGKLIIGGLFENFDGNIRRSIARLDENGLLDPCFDPEYGLSDTTTYGYGYLRKLIIEPDNSIIAGGSFSYYNGTPRPALAKIYGTSTINAISENGNAVPGTTGGISVQNVLANDLLNGAPATTSNVYLGQISTQHPNITLNSDTGAISVAPNTPPGLYLLTYQICEQDLGCYCSVTTDKITVGGPIVANNDTYSLNAGETTASVFNNDTLNGSSFAWSQVGVTLFDAGGIGATINYLGQITVPFGIAPGTYTLQYSICQVPGNLNCDPATVTVTVTPTLTTGIRANNDVQFIDKQSSGKTVIGGRFNFYNNTPARNMIRLNNDLSLDTSFQVQSGGFSRQGNYLESSLESLKVLDDDSVIVTGRFNDFNGQTVSEGIAKFNPDGDLDTYFNAGGSGAYLPVQGPFDGNGARINDVVVLPDGYMVAVGDFMTYNGYESHNIVGLKPDGSFNPDFNAGSGFSLVYGGGPNFIRLHQGKLLIAGNMYYYQGENTKSIMRLDLNGNIDPTFHQTGAGFYSNPLLFIAFNAVAIQPDDKILIGGAFISIDGYPSKNLVRLLPNGEIDPNFNIGTGFTHPNSYGQVSSISLQDDGKIVVGGRFTSYNGYPVKNIVRIDEYGNYDPSFNVGDGPQPEMNNIADILALYTQADGKIIIGGRFANFDNIYAGNITRIIPEYGVQGRPGAATDIFEEAAQGVTLYPNPSNGIFNLQVDGYDGEAFELEVYNALGQLVLKSNLSGQSVYQIDLSSVETGNYFVRMQNSNTVINKVIAVKR